VLCICNYASAGIARKDLICQAKIYHNLEDFKDQYILPFMKIEVCLSTVEEAIRAEKSGANQVELCTRLDLDGITPPLDLVRSVVESITIPVKVIINPKPFDYHYDKRDMNSIISVASEMVEVGVTGFVFGPLDNNKLPNIHQLADLSQVTRLPITYHKAIDESRDILESLQILHASNLVETILTSGGATTAVEGLQTILKMKEYLERMNSKIEIIAAGAINPTNLEKLHKALNLKHYHGRKILG